MYIFTQPVFQIGGKTSEGTLMQPSEGPKTRLEIKQDFARHGWSDVEFACPKAFCEFLEKKHYKDGRTVFFKGRADSQGLDVYSTSPHADFEKEIFMIGHLAYNN